MICMIQTNAIIIDWSKEDKRAVSYESILIESQRFRNLSICIRVETSTNVLHYYHMQPNAGAG